ncbi:MAG: conjugative transposon protein TraJ [Candidatus Pseudobacter hemicellulosilyticus]|uniref:Conjugative transposon protein TraJ n=1 Tax=Candidatus Pseudobacter hemicellulosilyticus TaxID=3121375 RepID=A0AAJ5WQ38_9BACT|nr:MAG: conjugative transposon protein TraJ [Pseudobacter sp.]
MCVKVGTALLLMVVVIPNVCFGQDLGQSIEGLNGVLGKIHDKLIVHSKALINVGRGLAGFAALWWIASRVWKHLANAEQIDFYPLLRPFAIGLCILNFNGLIALFRGVLMPIETGTRAMVTNSNDAVKKLLAQKEEALKKTELWRIYVGPDGDGNRAEWYRYTYQESPKKEGWYGVVGNDILFAAEKAGYKFRNAVKEVISEVLRIIFEAAALTINTLRTFQLVILTILGPLVLGLSAFDGLHHTLAVWVARYINIFLWVPVANIFGAVISEIQEEMIKLDLENISMTGYTSMFNATDVGYLIFLIIGIVGYTTVPSVANYIVHAAGGGALQQKVSSVFSSTAKSMGSTAMAYGSAGTSLGANMAADAMGDMSNAISSGMASQKQSEPYFADKLKGNG